MPFLTKEFPMTTTLHGQKAKNGFEALKDLDCNQDYVFDQNDAA